MESILNYSYRLLFCAILLFCWPALSIAGCNGPFKDKKISTEQLQQIIAQHQDWLQETGKIVNLKDKRRANLCGAQLQKMDLKKMDLSQANLMEANLTMAQLQQTQLYKTWLDDAVLNDANLDKANLTKAYLFNVEMRWARLNATILVDAWLDDSNLNDSNFNGADLTRARLDRVNLSEANLQHANLTNASLVNANLSYADLTLATLTGTILYRTDLKKVIYFPKSGKLPDLTSLLFAKNFRLMKYHVIPIGAPALRELRAAYQKTGMRPKEREITYMIKNAEEITNWEYGGWKRLESIKDKFLYNWPSKYGLAPQRPLKILLALIIVFGFLYWISIRSGKFGEVKIVWASRNPPKRISYLKRISCHKTIKLNKAAKKVLHEELRLMRIAFHLSMLSAFRVGVQRWDIGMWIRQLQIQEYELIATKGWLRRLCGLQSLLSIYLVALWAITQFGHPFE